MFFQLNFFASRNFNIHLHCLTYIILFFCACYAYVVCILRVCFFVYFQHMLRIFCVYYAYTLCILRICCAYTLCMAHVFSTSRVCCTYTSCILLVAPVAPPPPPPPSISQQDIFLLHFWNINQSLNRLNPETPKQRGQKESRQILPDRRSELRY